MKITHYLLHHRPPFRLSSVALQLAAVGLVSACGGGTSGDTSEQEGANPAVSSAKPSVSAAALTNDSASSISFAQAVAAGVIDAPQLTNTDTPVIAPANPLTVVDTDNTDPTDSSGGAIVPIGSETDSTDPDTDTPVVTDTPDTPLVPDSTVNPDPVDTADGDQDPEPVTDAQPQADFGNNENAISATEFRSNTSPGFNGYVLDDAIKIEWAADPDARGYNVYKQAEYYRTVFDTEFIDDEVFDQDYYYEIQAFDNDDTLYYIATGLTVSASTLGRIDPDAPVPDPDLLDGFELVFSDEFNNSVLDTTKWNTSYLWGDQLVINNEEQFYVDIAKRPDFGFNPFTFDGESLTINSIKTPDELRSKAMNMDYLSGVITSYDAFKFTYGYAEVRAKMTLGRGYWPAFWLLNAYYVDDKPEIDIMEFIGHNQDAVYATYHYFDSEGELRSTKSHPTPGVDYTNGWHTYAVDWRPGTLVFYIDGLEVHRVTDAKVSRQEMYVIANTAMGGWWAGAPDETTPFPGEFKMDYIRVYQRLKPYNDVFLNDGLSELPLADDVTKGNNSPSHRPPFELWPEGYPDGR